MYSTKHDFNKQPLVHTYRPPPTWGRFENIKSSSMKIQAQMKPDSNMWPQIS